MHENPSVAVESVRALRRRTPTRRVWCDPDLPDELVRSIIGGEPDRLLFLSEPMQVKDRCVVARHDSSAGPLLIKRHTWGGSWRTLRMAFRAPAARRCAELGLYLNEHGIPTPRPRAYVDFRVGPWTHRSYLVSDYVEGESLYRYIRFGSQSADEVRHLARQVADIWQTLVDLNVSHNDMKPENFIVDPNGDVWLIDLEKVHLGGNAERLQARQVFDVENFLHIRGWHRRLDARAVFAEAFLRTRHGERLRSNGVDRIAQGDDGQCDEALSVLILCDGGIDMAVAQHAIESVNDIADEVVLADVDRAGCIRATRNIELLPHANRSPVARTPRSNSSDLLAALRSPWVLILRQTERVTPFLAKEMQQKIAAEKAGDAFRIPVETQLFGRTLNRSNPAFARLVRKADFSANVQNADSLLSVSNSEAKLTTLAGTIQDCACATVSEYVERLNNASTSAAAARLARNEQAHFGRAALKAAGQMLKSYLLEGGFRSGSIGLQSSALKSVFRLIEEAKLYQLGAEFCSDDSISDTADTIKMPNARPHATYESTVAKAA